MAGAERGQVVDGRFELLSRLGRGGMGTVWRARDVALEREVALKEVRPPDGAEHVPPPEVLRERVLREARALARLNHPNVVRIYHIVDVAPHPWLVMELLPGKTLHTRARGGPVPPADAIRWGRDVLSALRAAHAAGIHHRDIKPANILLREDGSAVLTDFGIAALPGAANAPSGGGGIVGSPEYLAPERISGAPDHPAADLWSLGITLYILTEGHSPLRRESTLATLTAVLEDPIPPPVRSGPLTGALTALLQRDPAARPDAAALDALLAEAQRLAAGGAPAQPPAPVEPTPTETDLPWAPPPTPTPTATAPTRPARPAGAAGGRRTRGPVVLAALLGALLLIGVPTSWVLLRDGGDERERESAGPTDPPPDGAPDEVKEEKPEPPPSPVESDTETEPEETETGIEPEQEETEETEDPEPDPEEPEPDPDPEPDPEPDPGPEGFWVAQLFSEPVSTGEATRDRRLAAVRADVPEAQVLRSDDYASLNPGYWVIYAPGPFTDGRAAVARCAEAGLTTSNACVGRYLSQDPDDKALVCDPAGGGSGGCVRED